jgi:hypothetical protein
MTVARQHDHVLFGKITTLCSLSQGEIDRSPDGFVQALFRHGMNLRVPASICGTTTTLNALFAGTPRPCAAPTRAPGPLLRVLHHGPDQSQRGRRIGRLAGGTRRLQIPAGTVKRYLNLLDLLFITRRIPAWSTNLTTRAVAAPKLAMTDSGLTAHLTGMSLRRTRQPAAPVGPLMETFVLGELTRQLALTDPPVRLYHYRDRDQYKVDAVLESRSG